MSVTVQTYTNAYVSPWAKKELIFVGKRYSPANSTSNGFTLVFFHCAGSHKEAWEPCIHYLFKHAKRPVTNEPLIREAWAFDLPNHGEAAVKNEAVWKEGKTGLTVEEAGEAFKAFFATGILDGHSLIGVGHSLGAPPLVLSTVTTKERPGVVFKALVLIEPSLIARDLFNANREDRENALKVVNYAISKRKDEWKTREQALDYFKKRIPWQIWDHRMLELLVRYGLRDVEGGVRLCCDKENERRAYVQDEIYFDVIDHMVALGPSVPVHYIFGTRYDVIPEWVYKSVIDAKPPATLQNVKKTGHFTLHESPEGLGAAIVNIVLGTAQSASLPKL